MSLQKVALDLCNDAYYIHAMTMHAARLFRPDCDTAVIALSAGRYIASRLHKPDLGDFESREIPFLSRDNVGANLDFKNLFFDRKIESSRSLWSTVKGFFSYNKIEIAREARISDDAVIHRGYRFINYDPPAKTGIWNKFLLLFSLPHDPFWDYRAPDIRDVFLSGPRTIKLDLISLEKECYILHEIKSLNTLIEAYRGGLGLSSRKARLAWRNIRSRFENDGKFLSNSEFASLLFEALREQIIRYASEKGKSESVTTEVLIYTYELVRNFAIRTGNPPPLATVTASGNPADRRNNRHLENSDVVFWQSYDRGRRQTQARSICAKIRRSEGCTTARDLGRGKDARRCSARQRWRGPEIEKKIANWNRCEGFRKEAISDSVLFPCARRVVG